ncbi:MAG: hypothetical protein AAGG38_02065 [Planctomycetota bacterium]
MTEDERNAEIERLFGAKPTRKHRKSTGSPKPKAKPSGDSEASVMAELHGVLARHPGIRMFERRTVGVFDRGGRNVAVGVKGRADYWAVLSNGRHVEIEAKRRDGRGRLSPHQVSFREFCREHYIPYVVVKNGAELRDFLEKHLQSK